MERKRPHVAGKNFVAGICAESRTVVTLTKKPVNNVIDGKEYDYVVGPFKTKKGAEIFASNFSIGNVNEAERKAKEAA